MVIGSTTFMFNAWSTFIKKFGEKLIQTRHQQTETGHQQTETGQSARASPAGAGRTSECAPRAPPEALRLWRPFLRRARAPRPRSPPRCRASTRPHRRRAHATDRRSDGGVAAVRAATEGEDHGCIFAVTPPSPTNPEPTFLSVSFSPPRAIPSFPTPLPPP
jgi:hypothetical protein